MAELIKKEGYNASIRIKVKAEDFDKFCEDAYKKDKSSIKIEGFRKGKAPRKLIEKMYGEGVFYETALNAAFNQEFPKALEEFELEIVSQPKIKVEDFDKGEDVIINADLIIKPDFEIGKYRGLDIERVVDAVEEKNIDDELEKRRNKNARFVTVDERPVQNDDIIKLDFNGKLDGVEFDGGKAEDYTLTVGSKSFIPGFEEQLVGMNLGDEKVITVTFPEDYHEKSLAGKETTFDVKIKEIKEKQLPDLDDDFAMDISEFDTLDELRQDISKEIAKVNEKNAKVKLENKIIDDIIEDSTFDLPEEMIDNQIDYMLDDFERSLSYQGISLQMYTQMTNTTMDKIRQDMKPEAEKRIKSTMVLDKVKVLENIGYDDNQVEDEIRLMAETYKMDFDKLKETLREDDKKYLIENLVVKNTLNFLVAENEKK